MKKTIYLLGIATAIIFSACKNDSTENNTPSAYIANFNNRIDTVHDFAADTAIVGFGAQGPIYAGKFTFYSLENDSMVSTLDSATTKWDIAFSGTYIRVNNTISGPGIGGGFVYNGLFNSLTGVPRDSSFKTDVTFPNNLAIPWGSGKGWYTYVGPPTNLINPIPGKVLIIKTASGKYAKVEIMNYYLGGVTPDASATDMEKAMKQRYYTFRYSLSN